MCTHAHLFEEKEKLCVCVHACMCIKCEGTYICVCMYTQYWAATIWMIFLCSYRENPALGDPNSLIEELLEMRNKIRIKEAELIVIRGKVSLYVVTATHFS